MIQDMPRVTETRMSVLMTTGPQLTTARLLRTGIRQLSRDARGGHLPSVLARCTGDLISTAKALSGRVPTSLADAPIRAALTVLAQTEPTEYGIRRTLQDLDAIARAAENAHAQTGRGAVIYTPDRAAAEIQG